MEPAALYMMVSVYAIVTFTTAYFFLKVLRTPPKE